MSNEPLDIYDIITDTMIDLVTEYESRIDVEYPLFSITSNLGIRPITMEHNNEVHK